MNRLSKYVVDTFQRINKGEICVESLISLSSDDVLKRFAEHKEIPHCLALAMAKHAEPNLFSYKSWLVSNESVKEEVLFNLCDEVCCSRRSDLLRHPKMTTFLYSRLLDLEKGCACIEMDLTETDLHIPPLLKALSLHKNPTFRRIVAGSPKVDSEILLRMLDDECIEVRKAALSNSALKDNASIILQTFEQLSED